MARPGLAQQRHLYPAARQGMRATGVEAATRGRVQQAGHFAADHRSPDAVGVGSGHRVEQGLGRVFVRAVAGVDDGAVHFLRQQLHGAGIRVADDQHILLSIWDPMED